MSFSAAELNYIIFRYLEECGLSHSAYTFARESCIIDSDINGSDVPAGSLINIVQKGLVYAEYEMKAASSAEDAKDAKDDAGGLTLLEAVSDDAAKKRRERLALASEGPSSQAQKDREMREGRTNHNNYPSSSSLNKQRDRSTHSPPETQQQGRQNVHTNSVNVNGMQNKKTNNVNGLHRDLSSNASSKDFHHKFPVS